MCRIRQVALAAVAASCLACTGYTQEIPRSAGSETRLPIIDAHNHIMPDLDPATLMARLDEAGVSRIVLMALGAPLRARDEMTLRAHEQYPERVIPFLGLNGATRFGRSLLDYLDRQLATGTFRGMGEVLCRHYAFERTARDGTTVRAGAFTLAADSQDVQQLMALAARHRVVLVLHLETTAETLPALERALERNPRTKVIWAHQTPLKTLDGSTERHARKADPGQVAALLDRYPNLYADIAIGYESLFLTADDRRLPDAWKALYERHSDRFLVGMDMPFLAAWRTDAYLRRSRIIRGWLSQLNPAARNRLASENAERLLRRE